MKKIRNIPSGAVVAALLVVLVVIVSWSETLVLGQTKIDPGMRPDEKVARPEDFLEEMNDLNNTFLVQSSSRGEELAVKISTAARLEKEGKWAEATLEYNTILKLGDSSLAQMPGIDGERVYLGLKEYCRRRLKNFPPRGVAAYRLMVDGKVQDMLRFALKNMDETAIRQIVSNYPISGWADEALWYLANVLYERANYHEAMYYYKRLFEEFNPAGVSVSLPAAYIKFAVCAREIGPSAVNTLKTCLKNLPGGIAAKSVRVYDGKTRRYISVTVRNYLEETQRLLTAGVTGSVPGLGIEPEKFKGINLAWRTLQVRTDGGYDACVWRDRIYASLMGANDAIADQEDRDALAAGSRYSEGRVLGYDLDSGKLVFRAHKYRSLDRHAGTARNYFQSTVCVDDSSVYFVDYEYRGVRRPLHRTPRGIAPGGGPLLGHFVSELHACDKETGKLKWAQPWEVNHVGNRGGIDLKDARSFLNNMCITSAPVRYGAYLYVNVVRSLPDANEAYVACFNAASGALMWYSHLGGETYLSIRNFNNPQRRPEMGSRLTVVDNMVYFSTNMGVVGCASAETGDILWVAKYRIQPNVVGPASPRRPPVRVTPFVWHPTPPRVVRDMEVVVRGKTIRADLMFVAPRDSDTIYAFDVLTGKRLWERNINIGFPGNATHGQRWVNFTDKHVFIVQGVSPKGGSNRYSPRRLTVLETATGREIDFPGLVSKKCGRDILDADKDVIQVRPYVYGRWLVILTRTRLYCFDVDKDYALAADIEIDSNVSFSALQNMVLQGTRLFLMESNRITCYELSEPTGKSELGKLESGKSESQPPVKIPQPLSARAGCGLYSLIGGRHFQRGGKGVWGAILITKGGKMYCTGGRIEATELTLMDRGQLIICPDDAEFLIHDNHVDRINAYIDQRLIVSYTGRQLRAVYYEEINATSIEYATPNI